MVEKEAKRPTETILFQPSFRLLKTNHRSKNRMIVSEASVNTREVMNLWMYAMLLAIF